MNREEKAKVVETLSGKFGKANLVILFDYKGITVEQFNGLRRVLEKETESDLTVAKNTLAKRAIEGTDFQALGEYLVGPNAMLFSYGDPAAVAKSLGNYAKDLDVLEIRVGLLDGSLLNAGQVDALAKLPGREELLSMLLATMQAPVSNVVSLLANIPRGLVNALAQIKEQKEKEAA